MLEAVAPKNQKGEERGGGGGGGGSARALLKNKEHTESLLLFLLIQATLPLLLLRTVAHVSVRVCGVGDGGIETEPRAFCAADRRFPSFPSPRAPQCIIMWGGEGRCARMLEEEEEEGFLLLLPPPPTRDPLPPPTNGPKLRRWPLGKT